MAEQLMELVCASTRRHNLYAFAHLFNRHTIDLCRAFNKFLNKLDARIDIVRLESFKVEGSTGEVLDGLCRSTLEKRIVKEAVC